MAGAADLLMALMGASWKINVPNLTVSESNASVAAAAIEFQSDGDIISTTGQGGAVDEGDWITPKTAAPSTYTIRFDVSSGSVDVTSSATGTDLALTSSVNWSVTQNGAGTKSASGTVTIKNALGVVMDTGTLSLSATVT